MVFKKRCILVLWTEVASAFEGLNWRTWRSPRGRRSEVVQEENSPKPWLVAYICMAERSHVYKIHLGWSNSSKGENTDTSHALLLDTFDRCYRRHVNKVNKNIAESHAWTRSREFAATLQGYTHRWQKSSTFERSFLFKRETPTMVQVWRQKKISFFHFFQKNSGKKIFSAVHTCTIVDSIGESNFVLVLTGEKITI